MGDWSKATMRIAVGMMVVGFVLMVLAWNGAASQGAVAAQVPYLISGSFPGIGLVIIGAVLAIAQEMRRSTGMLAARLDELELTGHAAGVGLTAVPTDGTAVVAGRTTYHAPTCHLVRDRDDLQVMSPEDAASRGLAPCRICEPTAAEAS